MTVGLLFLLVGQSARATGVPPDNHGYYMQPTIRGDDVVFVSQGDLWRVSAKGGVAHSLTSHVAPASSPSISPDGKRVAFSGTYEGPKDAYIMPLDGDAPQRITFEDSVDVKGWTPDGKVLITTNAKATLPAYQLATVEPITRNEQTVPLYQANEGSYDPTGKTLFFTRFRFQGSNTKRYQGGTAQGIWRYDDGAPEAVNLTKSFTGTSKNPMWWQGRVYFLSDRDGVMNLWSMDPNGGSLKQHTHETKWDIQSAALDDGKVVYQLGADLHVFDIPNNFDKTLDITLASDFESTREKWLKNPGDYVTGVNFAPDGSKVVLTARGQIFVAPVDPGRFVEVRHIGGVRYRDALFSSDGKFVYALSDETGETEWWRMPANGVGPGEQITNGTKVLTMGGKLSPDGKHLAYYNKNYELWIADTTAKTTTKVATSQDGIIDDISWSPDSKWLAIDMPEFTFNRIALYSLDTGKTNLVTTDRSDAGSPTWSPDGKWLYFISDRTFRSVVGSPWGARQPEPYFDRQARIYALALTKGLRFSFQPPDELSAALPKPPTPAKSETTTKIDLDGIAERLYEVPIGPGNYRELATNGQRLFAVDQQTGGAPNVIEIDIKDQDVAAKVFIPGVSGYDLSQDGKQILINRGGRFSVIPAGSPAPSMGGEKTVDVSGWNFVIHPREEWRQMYDEAWRLERDYFWDRNMLDVDWNGIRKKYEPLVDRVRDRSELSNIFTQMIGELSTLHMFVYGGDNRTSPDSVGIASLGGVLERDTSKGGYRITRIYQGDPDYPETLSPLVKPGVDLAVGDVVTSINGEDTLNAPGIGALLRAQAGKQVLLHVKDAAGKERDCVLRTLSGGELSNLKYTDWEISRRRQADKESNNSVGYLHLRAMGGGDIATWERDFYPVFDRPGLIIDVRHNNGGNIDSWIIEKLLRKAWFFFQPRVGNASWNMQYAYRGHVVILCDESTASDGEAFTEGIKRLGLGKVIGTRTWGGEVWLSSNNFLGDGGIATAAEMGVYGPEGKWLIEGHGVDPDLTVDNLPHATYLGKDAQLEAALAYLAKEIKDHPVPPVVTPKYPNKSFTPKTIGGK